MVVAVECWALPPSAALWYFSFESKGHWSNAQSQCCWIWVDFINFLCLVESFVKKLKKKPENKPFKINHQPTKNPKTNQPNQKVLFSCAKISRVLPYKNHIETHVRPIPTQSTDLWNGLVSQFPDLFSAVYFLFYSMLCTVWPGFFSLLSVRFTLSISRAKRGWELPALFNLPCDSSWGKTWRIIAMSLHSLCVQGPCTGGSFAF